mmetsp:Transcript_70246/g.110990  ORF Transcript_70246/g.110990 Transcript_70246/m.110990 type:complete len:244 (-) Transcript_70246:246-977(-)
MCIFIGLGDAFSEVEPETVEGKALWLSRLLPSGAGACKRQTEVGFQDFGQRFWLRSMEKIPLVDAGIQGFSLDPTSRSLHRKLCSLDLAGTVALFPNGGLHQGVVVPQILVLVSKGRVETIFLGNRHSVLGGTGEGTSRPIDPVQRTTSITCPVVSALVGMIHKLLQIRQHVRVQHLDQTLHVFGPMCRPRLLQEVRHGAHGQVRPMHGDFMSTNAELRASGLLTSVCCALELVTAATLSVTT